MTSFEGAINKRVATSPIGARLGQYKRGPAVFWGDRPEGSPLAAIVFTLIDGAPDYTHAGRDELVISQIQADTLADTYAAAKSISDMLGELLEGAAVVDGRTFTHGFLELAQDIPVVGVKGARSVYGRTLRLSIYHKE